MLFGKAQQLSAIAAPRAAVIYGVQSPIRLKEKASRVMKLLAVVQFCGLLQSREKALSPDLARVKFSSHFRRSSTEV